MRKRDVAAGPDGNGAKAKSADRPKGYFKLPWGPLLVLGLTGFALIGHFVVLPQLAVAKMATAYVAKKVCSCRFVAGRDLASCKLDFPEDVSMVTVREDGQTIKTSAALGLMQGQARFTPDLGCAVSQ